MASHRLHGVLFASLFVLAGGLGPALAQTTPVPPPEGDQSGLNREVRLAEQAFTRDAKLPSWVEPIPIPDSPATGAVTLALADTQVSATTTVVAFQHLASRVNDASALTAAGRVQVTFIPDYQRVVLHTLRLWRGGAPLDRLAGAQIRFLQRETTLEQYMYSGVVTASIVLDDVRVGDTIELAYSVVGTNPVFGSTFSAVYPWDGPVPIVRRHVALLAPPGRHIAWKAISNLDHDFPKPVESTRDGLRATTFDGTDLKVVTAEPFTPNGFVAGRLLEFSEYASWRDVAGWGTALFGFAAPATGERAALVAKWKELPSDAERVVAALEFTQEQIRYFSVSLGTSSHRPTQPDAVLARRYGDCKDKTLLLIALLADMGIHAEPALARLGNRVGFDDWLPSPLLFDHVIAAVDVGTTRYYVDPTRQGQHGKLERMGQAHENAEVLPLAPDSTGLVRVKTPNAAELARNEVVESMTVDKLDGVGHLDIDQTLNGEAAEALRARFGAMTPEQIDTNLSTAIERRYTGAKIAGHIEIADDRVDNRVRLHSHYDLPTAMQKSGDGWAMRFLPSNVLLGLFAGGVQEGGRRAPVVLANPLDSTYRFDLKLPDDVSASGADQPAHIKDPWYDWESERTFHGNHAVATIHLVTRQTRVEAGDLAKVREEIKRFDQAQPMTFLVRANDIKKTGFLGIGGESVGDKIRKRETEIVERVGKAIDAGQFAPRDLARAYCQRGRALAALDKVAEARSDADRAVAAQPDDPAVLDCRANIRLATRDFKGAIDDAGDALSRGVEGPSRTYFTRARAEFALGRFGDAIEDLDRVDGSVGVSTAYRDVWLAMAYRRAGRDLPATLAASAAGADTAAWPRPGLSLFADRIAPERVVELARTVGGDEAEMNATEADFLVGEYYLVRGDDSGARKSFQSARDRGIVTYVEYDAAGAELERLKKVPAR